MLNIDWGVQNQAYYCLLVLCTTQEEETRAHLFFNCPYLRKILLAIVEALNMPMPTISRPDLIE